MGSLQRAAAPRLQARSAQLPRLVPRAAVPPPQQQKADATEQTAAAPTTRGLDQELTRLTKQTATTFAPRASGATGKNPAVRGSTLYAVFEVQAWAAVIVGGLLSFNVIFPTDEPSIPRLLGMWSIWMFTIPSLRAKECTAREKDALNLLFVVTPLINVVLPFVWKNFGFIFTADTLALAAVYAWKGVWAEVYGLPLDWSGAADAAAAPAAMQQQQQEAAGDGKGEQA